MKKTILVAAHQISGGIAAKNKPVEPWTIESGTQITAALRKSHGLGDDDVASLQASGAIVEVNARVAEAGGSDNGAELAAAIARAEAAEGEVKTLTERVTELEQLLAEATKPAA